MIHQGEGCLLPEGAEVQLWFLPLCLTDINLLLCMSSIYKGIYV